MKRMSHLGVTVMGTAAAAQAAYPPQSQTSILTMRPGPPKALPAAAAVMKRMTGTGGEARVQQRQGLLLLRQHVPARPQASTGGVPRAQQRQGLRRRQQQRAARPRAHLLSGHRLQPGAAAGAGKAAQQLLHPLPLLRLSLLLLVLVRTQVQGRWQASSLVGALGLLEVARAGRDSQQRLLLLQLLGEALMTVEMKTATSSSRGAK